MLRRLSAALVLLAACSGAAPGPTAPIYRVGFISSSTTSLASPLLDAFRSGIKELGYEEGRNLKITYKFATEGASQLPGLADELVKEGVQVIVAGGSEAITAAMKATKTIPIVMTNSGDAVNEGFVASLARPGGNVTGLTQISPTLAPKRLEVLKQTFPSIRTIAVVWNPIHPNTPATFAQTKAAVESLGLTSVDVQVKDPVEFDAAFARLTKDRPGALVVLRDPFMIRNRQTVIDFAAKAKLPAMYETSDFVEAGGLMSYGPSLADLYRRSAGFVGKILKGTEPAVIPVELPLKFELVLNKKTASAATLTFPAAILAQADRIIE